MNKLLLGILVSVNVFATTLNIPFSNTNVECIAGIPNGLGHMRVYTGAVLNSYTKLGHKSLGYERQENYTSNLCKDLVDPLIEIAKKNSSTIDAALEVKAVKEQCCIITGGSIYAPKLSCWDEPAERVELTFTNGLKVKSTIKFRECPI
jgi:hypothetical protein